MTVPSEYNEDFERGVQHAVELLAKTLKVEDWVGADGSEDYDTDLADTMLNILAAKGLYDRDEAKFATLSALGAIELKMTPISEALPARDDLWTEQTFLTYCDRSGTWDLSTYDTGDGLDPASFRIGVTHWLDITSMWPGVTAQMTEYHTIGRIAELTIIANKAREWAAHYPESSDGRNTFVLLAEWVEARTH